MVEADYYLGPVRIHMYSWILLAGVLAGFFVARTLARQRNVDIRHIENLVLLNVFAGLLGARIFHVLSAIDYYRSAPAEIFYIWQGGLGIFGGIAAGILVTFLYVHHHKIPFFKIADILAPGLVIAQSIGRWGNFFNQEAYGYPTDLPWKIFIAPKHRFPGYEGATLYHPVFLYESLFLAAVFLLLLGIFKKAQQGHVFAVYLILYGIGRFWLERLRLDTNILQQAFINQTISIALVALGALLIWRFDNRKLEKTANI